MLWSSSGSHWTWMNTGDFGLRSPPSTKPQMKEFFFFEKCFILQYSSETWTIHAKEQWNCFGGSWWPNALLGPSLLCLAMLAVQLCWSVHHFGLDSNLSTTIAIKFCTDIYVAQRMKPYDFGDFAFSAIIRSKFKNNPILWCLVNATNSYFHSQFICTLFSQLTDQLSFLFNIRKLKNVAGNFLEPKLTLSNV